ncbi:hypothetical protein CW731_05810 [Polaribacter sp. ALD11]|uniref:hypothetical protein n=1 Tax=Polaribacter sp. ALD11 TaxID=2058137 RepID=UPI000C315A19|nr:hypothetical protein [Polaribacter sp. ALD11]AUC84838.1 hypothetical protein CW731_05810 [Polaribacter sp. ALD11]
MKSLKKYEHITDLIHFAALNEKIREEIKKYYFIPDMSGRANFLHLFEYTNKPEQKIFSLCNEYEEWEEKKEEIELYTETEFKISIVGNPHWTHCKKCIKKFNIRKID